MKKFFRNIHRKQAGIIAACAVLVFGLIVFITAPSGKDPDRGRLEAELKKNSELLAKQSAAPMPSATPVPEDTPTPSPTADPSIAQQPITAIGDSVMLGAASSLQSLFPNMYIDAAVSRQVWDAPDILTDLDSRGLLYPNVVIALGGNGTFRLSVGENVMNALNGHTVWWILPYGINLQWQGEVSSVLRQLDEEYDNMTVLDWPSAARGHSEWFYHDGMHLNADGQKAYADFVYRSLTHCEPQA